MVVLMLCLLSVYQIFKKQVLSYISETMETGTCHIGYCLFILFQIKEFSYDYTNCENIDIPRTTCANFFQLANNTGKVCHCTINAELEKFDVSEVMYGCVLLKVFGVNGVIYYTREI